MEPGSERGEEDQEPCDLSEDDERLELSQMKKSEKKKLLSGVNESGLMTEESKSCLSERPLSFLLVDDNIFNLQVLETFVFQLYPDAEVHSAFSPMAAIEEVETVINDFRQKKRRYMFDYILLDINMP